MSANISAIGTVLYFYFLTLFRFYLYVLKTVEGCQQVILFAEARMMALLQRNVLGSESYSTSHAGSFKSNVNGMSRAVSGSNLIVQNDDNLENVHAENYFSLSLPDQVQANGSGNLLLIASRENNLMMLNAGGDEQQVNLGNGNGELHLPNRFGNENKYGKEPLSVTERLTHKDAVEVFRIEL